MSIQSNISDRVIAVLLIEMDGNEKLKGVTIIATTNRPDCIDPVGTNATWKPINPYIEIERLVELTKNYSGAEIAAVCDEAGLILCCY
ncbi:unnamed protein product [Rotaria sp. Silwood2]|nr:unnamed protein product [Rotaria sp. Silwood2]